MKKWINFFFLSFFSHKSAKEGARRGYGNFFLAFAMALVFLWMSFYSADMLPFGVHYGNSPDFRATAYNVFANADTDKRIEAEIENGKLKAKKQGSEYADILLVSTLQSDSDKQSYSVNGYHLVVDMRPADTIAEIEAYCISNDGKDTVISYEDYLTLSEVARLNFDFKIRYTGNALVLTTEAVAGYRSYVESLGDESKAFADKLSQELAEGKITLSEYNRSIYELYFTSYYPEITEYESTSALPLLRNYYYHQYIKNDIKNFIFIFDDYITGSFETDGGIDVSFYGFYSELENRSIVNDGANADEAKAAVDGFIKDSFKSVGALNSYAHAMNVMSLLPFIALMVMVVTLLTYSILKLRGVESISALGAMFKIVASFVWFSGVISAVLSVIAAFFIQRNLLAVLPLILFFLTLAIRSVIFALKEGKVYQKQIEQQEVEHTEA